MKTIPQKTFYVDDVQGDRVLISSLDSDLSNPDQSFGAYQSLSQPGLWYVLCSQAELPVLLVKFRDAGLPFLDTPSGWPPAAVFENLRKEGKVTGNYSSITFRGDGGYEIEDGK